MAERLIELGFVCATSWDEGLFAIATEPELEVRTEPTQFEQWWARYPRKEAKTHAKKVYIGVALDLSLTVFADSTDRIAAAEDYLLAQLERHQDGYIDWLRMMPTTAQERQLGL